MYTRVILALWVQTVFVQIASSQNLGGSFGWVGPSLAPILGCDRSAGPFGYDLLSGPLAFEGVASWTGRGVGCNGAYAPAIDITPTSSGGLIVTSSSPVPPIGISVMSENAYEGILAVAGEVPFVGTTGMEGIVPTTGAAAVSHSCGNGNNAVVNDITEYGAGLYAPAAAFFPGIAPVIAPAAAIVPGIAPAAYTGCDCGEYLY